MALINIFDFYNQIAEKYPESKATFQCPLGELRAQAALKALDGSDGLVLDLGCHDGYLAPRIRNYFGLDIALPALKRVKKPRVWGDANRIPFKNGSFDFILCLEVLEHVYNRVKVLKECGRVLRDDGKLVLSVPYDGANANPCQTIFFAEFDAYGIPNREYLHGTFNEEQLAELLGLSGFKADEMVRGEGYSIIQVVAHKNMG